jgi:predicted unusual protein kinase regulating ubiquinone biosynthesis (AarF/ABC1/UbiB family)
MATYCSGCRYLYRVAPLSYAIGAEAVEQMMLPIDLPLEQRLIILIAQMPSLQKIGQIVARNRNLDPKFRAELTRLENAIRDITPAEIRTEVEHQLGQQLETYHVELKKMILTEASVSAVIRFTWVNPVTSKHEQGVFKVLKPYISEYFSEELGLLQGLAEFFETNRQNYALAEVSLRDVFDDVRLLLEQEINFLGEQANLTAAYQRYTNVSGIRVPRLIRELSTPTITAMTEEKGVKVTEAFSQDPFRRIEVAARIVEALLAIPLFSQEEEAIFHADPHAGNLFVDEKARELVLFDWALTERLSREERRQLVLLVLAVALRNERHIFQAIAKLSKDNITKDRTKANIVRSHVAHFISHLSPLTVPGIAHVLTLVDNIILSGVTVSASLLMFRKVLFTLDGVLHDVTSGVPVDLILTWYIVKQQMRSASRLNPLSTSPTNFRFPLSNFDRIALTWSAQFFGLRVGLQTTKQMRNMGLRKLQHILFCRGLREPMVRRRKDIW